MMRSIAGVSCAVVLLALCASSVAGAAAAAANAAAGDTTGKSAKEAVAKPDQDLEPFPAAKSIHQAAVIAGKRLDYVVTVGSVTLKDAAGKTTGEVVYTAYTVPGATRPVTFSFNGGPGAASVYLNLGALGPKKIEFGRDGDTASGSASLHDNPNSWLGFTDLVFIDPIGTGFSRSRVDEEQTKRNFLTAEADIHYLSEVVYDWLVQNNRMTSRKYLIGESYGGYRVPRLAAHLQTEIGVGISGITMVSPALDPPALGAKDALSPLRWAINLPSMAAGYYERQGKPLDDASMAAVELYSRTEFVTDFLAGRSDKAATDRLATKVAALTGLDPGLVRKLDGRVDVMTYLRESRRGEGRIGSFYDSNVTAFDPFPASAEPDFLDPILASSAPFEEAITQFVVGEIGWKVTARYYTNNFDIARKFDRDDKDSPVTDLRKAMAVDPNMAVTIVNGWNDLACPYFASRLVLAQLPDFGSPGRAKLHVYPGGHMFYARPESAAAFRRDLESTYSPAS
jgi:carboxypeptidase C (cathepsin A)